MYGSNDEVRPRNRRKILEHVLIGRDRRLLLSRYGWYKNALGGYAHPHALDYMSYSEILSLTPAQLDYKLEHGSMSKLPSGLIT